MTHDPADDVLRELEGALALTPSREFAEGVRARIRDASARRRAWPMWTMVGLATAAAVVLAVVTWPRREAAPPTVAVTASRAPDSGAPAPAANAPVGAASVADAAPGRATVTPAVPHLEPRRVTAPEVIVPRDQALALEALVTGLNNGTIDAGSLAMPPPDASVPLAPAAQIEIVPIVIPPIDGRAPGASGGGAPGGIR